MAKLTALQWTDIRRKYEVDILSSTKLSKEYGVAESTICRRLKKDGWNRGKTQDAIEKKVNSIKALAAITQDNAGSLQAINKEVDRRLRLEDAFFDAVEFNQKLANKLLQEELKGGTIELQHVQHHSQITARNKDSVFGKPQTQVNIQNNVSTDADSVIQRLQAKHQ